MIKEKNEEYVVEFSVTIMDPTYNELRSGPETPHHNDIRELTEKVRAECEFTDIINVNILVVINILMKPIFLYENIIKTFN